MAVIIAHRGGKEGRFSIPILQTKKQRGPEGPRRFGSKPVALG
jgi:hypothetical protein